MTILFFEEFPDSLNLQWVAVRAEDFKHFPSGKESLVVCFKKGVVYEYVYTKMAAEGNYSPREVFSTMRKLKFAKAASPVRPGAYFNNVKRLLREYKIHGKFDSFDKFHMSLYGKKWKAAIQEHPPVRVWAGRLVGW